ncbi:hypothetical protein [Sinosporangium siamense]|uniref:Uncharacterized protein n=1 Tax=Sinosporangium siamense TaxID=1367973 RepID=A0A919V9X0_9ACTN|nr:hypothetical protein [Sinosporangium siamense]GII95791.1 hypothetical protein Ssi02_60220 [Sinosporangium siamense]
MPYPGIDRRRVLAAAALGRTVNPPAPAVGREQALHAVSGTIVDVSPHMIVLETADGGEARLVVAPWVTAWRGGVLAPADLPVGARAIVRAVREGTVAERIWADVTRITGKILSITAEGSPGGKPKDQIVELDCGPHRGRRTVVVPYRASGRLRVRHPQFDPGYLFDAIGVREGGVSYAYLPATSQPAYRAGLAPPPPPAYGGTQSRISGTATWSDSFDDDERGAAYPMVEQEDVGCDESGKSCVGLPYLALGSMLVVHNVCTGRSEDVQIVACGCVSGGFCDRCVECGTSPRGRIAELAPASFVELGGDLIKGCFNVRIGVG